MDSDNNKKTSFRIEDQLPLFVKEDHPQFKNLLEVYYKFMESIDSGGTRNALSAARNIANILDIDYTDDAVLNEFRRQFYSSLPENSVVDIQLFEKNIVNFYRAKGSQRAFEFLFKIVFGIQKIEFRYPKVEILKASSGVWVEEKSIHVQTGTVGLENLVTKKIVGSISGATAIVEKIEGRLVGQISISELYLTDILGTFLVSEVIRDTDGTFEGEVLLGILDDVSIINPGRGYIIGDPADIINGPAGIIEVSETTNNQVINININSGGTGYELGSTLTVSPTANDVTGADAQAFITQINFDNFVTRDLQVIGPFRDLVLTDVILGDRIIGISGNSTPKDMYDDGDAMVIGGTPIGFNVINNVSIGDTLEEQFGVAYSTIDILEPPRWNIGDIKYEQSLDTSNTSLNLNVDPLANVIIQEAIEFRTYSVGQVSEIQVTNFGDNYSEIPIATATNPFLEGDGLLGNNANLEITFLGGGVVDGRIIDPGAGYFGPPNIVFPNSRLENTTLANTANGTVSIQPLREYDGRYEGTDGQPSSDKVLQDNLFFQDYSYVLQTDRSISDYRDVVKELLHPSGMELFGEVNIENELNASLYRSSNGSAQQFADDVSDQQGFVLNLDDPNQIINTSMFGLLDDPDALDARMFQFNSINENTHRGFNAGSMGSIDTITLPGLLGFGFKGPRFRSFVAEEMIIDYWAANTIGVGTTSLIPGSSLITDDAFWRGNLADPGDTSIDGERIEDIVIGDVVNYKSTSFNFMDQTADNLVERLIELGGLLPVNFASVDTNAATAGQFKLIDVELDGKVAKIHIDFGPFLAPSPNNTVITGDEFRVTENARATYSSNLVSIADRNLIRADKVSASIRLEGVTSDEVFDREMVIQRILA